MSAHLAYHLEHLLLIEAIIMALDHHMHLHHESHENKNESAAIQLTAVVCQQALEIRPFALPQLGLLVGAILPLLETMLLLLCRHLLDLLLLSHPFLRTAVPHP